jgi:hypothetical protein
MCKVSEKSEKLKKSPKVLYSDFKKDLTYETRPCELLFITHLSIGYCFTFITFKEWYSVKSLT